MPGIRIDGDYLIIENSDRPQKWTANELGEALKWASTDGKKLMKLEHDVYDSLDKVEERVNNVEKRLTQCVADIYINNVEDHDVRGKIDFVRGDLRQLLDYLGVEIKDTPEKRAVTKKET